MSVIQKLREERGISQRELASSLGMARSTLQMYESGHPPSVYYLQKISDFFGVPAEELLPGIVEEAKIA